MYRLLASLAFAGALCAAPISQIVNSQPDGPGAKVSYWIVVPGGQVTVTLQGYTGPLNSQASVTCEGFSVSFYLRILTGGQNDCFRGNAAGTVTYPAGPAVLTLNVPNGPGGAGFDVFGGNATGSVLLEAPDGEFMVLPPQEIPEPATWLVVAGGLLAIGLCRRESQRRALKRAAPLSARS